MTYEQIRNLRLLVDGATDSVLVEFGKFCKMQSSVVCRGYPIKSAGFSGGYIQTFEDLAGEVDCRVAQVAFGIIYDDLDGPTRRPIEVVYTGGRWLDDRPLDEALLRSVAKFERAARSKGLL